MIDTTKRIGKNPFYDRHVVTAAEDTADEVVLEYRLPESLLTNIVCLDNLRSVDVDMVITPLGEPRTQAITLMQRESTRGANYDIIWEGEHYLPPLWKLVIVITGIVDGDIVQVHGGYDICAQS